MIDFFRAGGWGMWLVLLLGSATLLSAVLFARQPDERRLSMMRAMSVACFFSIFTALSSNLAAVMYTVPQLFSDEAAARMSQLTMVGLGESLAPAIMGGVFLTLTWLVAAVGMRTTTEGATTARRVFD